MTHPRTLLREGIRAQLAAFPAIVSGGITVYKSRYLAIRSNRFPAISVSILSDETDTTTQETAPREIRRDAAILIECISKQSGAPEDPNESDLADSLDDLCEFVEDAIAEDDTISDLAEDSLLQGTEFTFEEDGDKLVGTAAISYVMEYQSHLPKTTDNLDDFDQAEVQFSLNAEQAEADRAKDSLTDLHE